MELRPGLRWLFYGRSGSGKTTEAIKVISLYKRLPEPPFVMLISPDAHTDDAWTVAEQEWKSLGMGELVDAHFHEYSPNTRDMLTSICDRRTRAEEGTERDLVLMLDDLGEDHTLNMTRLNNPVRKIAIRAPHLKITMIVLYQSVSETMNILAKNADIIVAKKILDLTDLKVFHKKFLGQFTMEEFKKAARECWINPFDSMVIDRTSQEVKIFRNFEEPVIIREKTIMELK